MEDGEYLVNWMNAQYPVEVLSIADFVNVTTLPQHMVGMIALLMAQLMLKQRRVMKTHAQVGCLIKRIS